MDSLAGIGGLIEMTKQNIGSFGVGTKQIKNKIRKAKISDDVFGIKMIMAVVAFKVMWARELLKNSLESTAKYLKTEKGLMLKQPAKILVRVLKLEGLTELDYTGPKICTLNYGGMSFEDLRELPNIFCNSDKVRDFLENFGVGVKITCTKFSELLFISKKGEDVHFTRFGLNDKLELVIFDEPTDCTDWAYNESEFRNYNMDHDWTEVVLLGKQNDQNTLTHTFSPAVDMRNTLHMIQNLFQRFWEIPANIEVNFQDGTSNETTPHNGGPKSGGVVMKTINDVWNKSTKALPDSGSFEIMIPDAQTGHGCLIRYDAPRTDFGEKFWQTFITKTDQEKNKWLSAKGLKLLQHPMPDTDTLKELVAKSKYVKDGIAAPTSSYTANRLLGNSNTFSNFSGVVWGKPGEQEIYCVTENGAWKSIASKLGIFGDYNYFKIYVILDYKQFKPNLDRSCLIDAEADIMDQVVGNVDSAYKFKDFVDLMQRCIDNDLAKPFRDMIDKHNTKNRSSNCDDIMDDMLKLEDFKPHEEKQDEEVPDKNTKGTDTDENNNNNNYRPLMPDNIKFTKRQLTCPSCRKEKPKVITLMPRGTKICPRCGYKRPTPKTVGIGKKTIEKILQTPKPKFVEEEALGKYWARSEQTSETSDVIFVNPKHESVKRVYNRLWNEHPEMAKLDEGDLVQLENDAFEILKASTGVQYMTAKGDMQHADYFDNDAWENWTDKAQYTHRAKYDGNAFIYLQKKYRRAEGKKAKSKATGTDNK